jgi:ABC-type phosphate transport system permease subunit
MAVRRRRSSIVKLISLGITAIPLIAFILIVINIIYNSIPAVTEFGLSDLFSTKMTNVFSGDYVPGQYGLIPAIWGSLMLVIISFVIAFPSSLAMAVFASEFSMRGMGRGIELVLAVCSGIPPVIYSLFSYFVMRVFMIPKFAGNNLPESYLMALPGLPPWTSGMLPNNQSTLLGGIFLSLLIIPFVAPMILDAIRNVPHGLKEASVGLGATRWHTLTHIILPSAASGIVGAISIGILKTLGDVIISAWTIGYVRNGMPAPLWDITEKVAPLSSTGVGLLAGLESVGASGGTAYGGETGVAYFTALLLLVIAFLILGAASLFQQYYKRRMMR